MHAQFCHVCPEALRRTQVFMDGNNEFVVGAFNRRRSKNRVTYDLLIRLFDLQVQNDFVLSLQWITTANDGVAATISRPSRDTDMCS